MCTCNNRNNANNNDTNNNRWCSSHVNTNTKTQKCGRAQVAVKKLLLVAKKAAASSLVQLVGAALLCPSQPGSQKVQEWRQSCGTQQHTVAVKQRSDSQAARCSQSRCMTQSKCRTLLPAPAASRAPQPLPTPLMSNRQRASIPATHAPDLPAAALGPTFPAPLGSFVCC